MKHQFWIFLFLPIFAIGQKEPIVAATSETSSLVIHYSMEQTTKTDQPMGLVLEAVAIVNKCQHNLYCDGKKALSFVPDPLDGNDMATAIAKTILHSNWVYYENRVKEDRMMQVIEDDQWTIIDAIPSIEWEITDSTATVSGVDCRFATGVISSTCGNDEKIWAWFSMDYPVPFGPAGIGGLPGLVFQAKRQGLIYTIKSINTDLDDQVKIEAPTKGEKISFEKFVCGEKK